MNQSRFSDDRSVDGHSMLTSFDLGALEEMDPSLSNPQIPSFWLSVKFSIPEFFYPKNTLK